MEKNAREEKIKEIRDAKKIEKARITQIEKDRVGQLTPAQKKNEALVKRNINKEKKADELQAARNLVGSPIGGQTITGPLVNSMMDNEEIE